MKFVNFILTFIALFAASSCTRLSYFIANFPTYFSGQTIVKNIEYGSQYGSRLDVYIPQIKKSENINFVKPYPVIVFFYGGKLSFGNKNDYAFAAEAFTKLGYVVVIPDYVKYPEYKFPAWQYESAKAVDWVHNNISKYNGDAKNLFVAGHSAGAHIGALLATDNKYMSAAGGNKNYIKAFAGLAGPYDFTPDEPDLKDMFGPPENYKFMQTSNYIDGTQAPMLLLWGEKDDKVGEININHLKPAFAKNGGEYKVIYYPNIGHIEILAALSKIGQSKAPLVDDIDKFFKQHLDDL